MTDEISKAVESANKNLDNALEVAVDALKGITELSDGNQEYNASQFKWAQVYADDALQKIAAILKVKQKD